MPLGSVAWASRFQIEMAPVGAEGRSPAETHGLPDSSTPILEMMTGGISEDRPGIA